MNWLDSKVMKMMEGGLDATTLRNKVLVDNIANNDTPDFKRSDVNFDVILQDAMGVKDPMQIEMKRTNPAHLAGTNLSSQFVVQDLSSTIRNDGNNVDIDKEMTLLAENTLQYNALANSYTKHLTNLRLAIKE